MKSLLLSLAIAGAMIIGAIAQPTQAHELLPKALQEYIQSHPNATVEELQLFLESQNISSTNGSGNLLTAISNQETSFLDTLIDFIKLGIEHILAGPDHILFVLSLLLVFISWREILKLTGSFTLAHSFTLILAGTGALTLTSRVVEPLIALSISYVALTSVFLKGQKFFGSARGKLATVFFFGLFHGLGFAGLLQEISIPKNRFLSSLIAFNVGIELGQILIIVLALPFIYLFKDKPWYPRVIKTFAILIGITGLFWAVQRITGL